MMKVGVLHGGNYPPVVGRKTWEELTVHLHQLHPKSMTSIVTHAWPSVVQVVGS